MNESQKTVLALLQEASAQGRPALTKTVLIKLLYLLDVYHAEENTGVTWTGWEWRFAHFGPFAVAGAESLKSLARSGQLSTREGKTEYQGHDYMLFSLPADQPKKPGLCDMGVSRSAALRIAADIRRYANNLPALLDYVYFHTAPMTKATPGSVLRFDGCKKQEAEKFKPVRMRPLPRKRVREFRKKLRNESNRKSERPDPAMTGNLDPAAIYDEIYAQGMRALDGEELPVGLKGKARIRPTDGHSESF